MVVAEAAYLIDRQVGPAGEVALYASIIEHALAVEAMTGADWTRVRELIDRYQDVQGCRDLDDQAPSRRHRRLTHRHR